MVAVRSTANPFELVNLQGVITEIPNTSNFIKGKNLFQTEYTHLTSVEFDKDTYNYTMMAFGNRDGMSPTSADGPTTEKFSLVLPYSHKKIAIQTNDWARKVLPGTDREKTKQEEIARRLIPLKMSLDQTHEYMMWNAIKGDCITPDGTSVANMFTLFGLTRSDYQLDFDLGGSVDVGAKCRLLRSNVQKNLKTGGSFSGDLLVAVSGTFFEKLVNHASVTNYFTSWGASQAYISAKDTFSPWGITAMFSFNGIMFVTYDHDFVKPDGTSASTFTGDEGYVIPVVNGAPILKAVYGGSRREGALGGAEMHFLQTDDPKGFYTEIDYETAPLYYCTNPATLWRVFSST